MVGNPYQLVHKDATLGTRTALFFGGKGTLQFTAGIKLEAETVTINAGGGTVDTQS